MAPTHERRTPTSGGPRRPSSGVVLAAVVAIGVLAAGQASAQTVPSSPGEGAAPAGYRIGPADLLMVQVQGIRELARTVRVSNSGKIHLPYIGIVEVAGMTVRDLEREAATRLREGGLVEDPWVRVFIEQYRAQPVYILGEVIFPGQFVMKDEMYLIDLITLGGGFNDVATPIGYLYRRQSETGEVLPGEVVADQAIEIDFDALNEGARPELNLRLRGGDVLYVPERRREFFYVVGDVLQPGSFEMREDGPPLLTSQAIAQAAGPLRTAKLSEGVLVRVDERGQQQELPVDFKAVLEGRQPEIIVRPDDIIFIPGSTAKTLGYALLGTIPSAVERGISTGR